MKNIVEHAKKRQEEGIGILSVDKNILVLTIDVLDEQIINEELDGGTEVEICIIDNDEYGYTALAYKRGDKDSIITTKHLKDEEEVILFLDVNLYSLTNQEHKVFEMIMNDVIEALKADYDELMDEDE